MKSCAVIGANGFLGQALVRSFISKGYKTYGVYNKNTFSVPDNCSKISIADFLTNKLNVDFIVFSVGSFSCDHNQLIYLNCDLLRTIVNYYDNSRIVFISSANVYGVHEGLINETSPFNLPGIYGRSKLAGEFIVSAAKSFAILRFVYLYGEGLDNGSFLPNIIKNAKEKKIITLYGKGQREQDYLHISDATTLCIKAMEYNANEVFLGASGSSYSNLNIANVIAANIKGCKIEHIGDDIGDSFYFDPSQTCYRLSWKPRIDIFSGINNMVTCGG